MKKFMLFTFLAFGLLGCSDDDDSNDTSNGDIVGDWNATSLYYEGQTNTEFQGMSITQDFSAQATSFDNYIVTFNNDNTYDSSGSLTLELTVSTNGLSQTQEFELNDLVGSGTWAINGDTMVLTDSQTNETVSYDIEVLNGTTLTLNLDDYVAQTMSQNGLTGTVSGLDTQFTMEKIQ